MAKRNQKEIDFMAQHLEEMAIKNGGKINLKMSLLALQTIANNFSPEEIEQGLEQIKFLKKEKTNG